MNMTSHLDVVQTSGFEFAGSPYTHLYGVATTNQLDDYHRYLYIYAEII